jgi:group II intron reverse transcriptase/maturase
MVRGALLGLTGWGTAALRTHLREGEAGHNVFLEGNMGGTLGPQTISPQLREIAERAARYPDMIFNNVHHKVNVDLLREAYRQTRKDGSPGLDKVTAAEYAENLEENLGSLCARLKWGTYVAPPVERVWIDKENGKQRPIGKPTFEDKIVQRAVSMVLQVIYDVNFHDFSHAFRKGHSQHQAIHELRENCLKLNIGWIVSADITGLFDNIDHGLLQEFIRRRVIDGGILRLIGKWLNAGVFENGEISYPERGTPQGGVVSPVLSNIFLHYVLDDWFVEQVKPRMKGRCFLIRFADDFIIGCELESDARRIMEVLPKRFDCYGLGLHPDKTSMIPFKRPSRTSWSQKGSRTFDFLGFTFYWSRSRRGYWVIKKKTASKRLSRFMKRLWQWCRENRHEPLKEQYQALCSKLRGHFQYYGVRGNFRALEVVFEFAKKAWRFWLSRRSHKGGISWEKFEKIRTSYPFPKPRIVHNI